MGTRHEPVVPDFRRLCAIAGLTLAVALPCFWLAGSSALAVSPAIYGIECRGDPQAHLELREQSAFFWRLRSAVKPAGAEALAAGECRWRDPQNRPGGREFVILNYCCNGFELPRIKADILADKVFRGGVHGTPFRRGAAPDELDLLYIEK